MMSIFYIYIGAASMLELQLRPPPITNQLMVSEGFHI